MIPTMRIKHTYITRLPPKNATIIFCNVVTGTYPKQDAMMLPTIMPMNPNSIYNAIKIFQSDLRIFKLFHTLLSDNPVLIRSNPPTMPSFIMVTTVLAKQLCTWYVIKVIQVYVIYFSFTMIICAFTW